MGYRVVLTGSAAKDLARLDKPVQRRIAALIDKIEASDNPRFNGKPLEGEEREWRYRVGDWRMVCEIQDKIVTVLVIRIRHRGDVYR